MTPAAPRHLAELDLPAFDVNDTALSGPRFHEAMADVAARGWLARLPLGVLTLDRESSEHFLRTRSATFPGQLIAELYGIDSGPLREEIDRNVLHLDGDVHARLRRLVNPFFTPRASDRWRPVMRQFLEELWEPVGEACEFVEAFAKPYPSQTIAAVMGAPLSDAPRLHHWSQWVQRQFDGPSLSADRAAIEQAVEEFYGWCDALLSSRRADLGDDLVSALIREEQDGDRLSDVELVNLVLNVLIGGVDTTQAQLAHGVRLFAEHPDQWELLRADLSLVPRAVDEVLRHEPITPFTARVLTADVVFRDVLFPTGTVVMVGAFAGNRDGAGDPSFDLTADRSGARLLTFGAGIHHCLGMNLARAELEEAFAFLAPRTPGLRLTAEPVFGTVQGIYGLDRLDVAWDAARP
ncbi:MAG: cytochrome [Frankiales bacterium]|nr:cytochrome [Frankiales bacterium]